MWGFNMVREFYLYECKNPYMMELAMRRPPGVVMSTAEKPMQQPPSLTQEVKVFRPRFGIRAENGGLSVDVSALPEKEKDEPKRG
jgi:hypothetical protein